jgi:RNA polymerase sigma factor (sigma-70 family)
MQTTEFLAEALTDLRSDPDRIPDEQFWRIVERYRATLVNQAMGILGSQEDAEDCAQDTLCKAFTALDQLRDPSKIGGWLRSINHRNAISVYRRKKDAREERLATGQVSEIPARRSGNTSGAAVPSHSEKIMRSMDGLPEPFREVLVLRYWEKLNNDGIAARLNIPVGTVRSRLARADKMMTDRLKAILRQENHPQ